MSASGVFQRLPSGTAPGEVLPPVSGNAVGARSASFWRIVPSAAVAVKLPR
jgi:hypothetical protein